MIEVGFRSCWAAAEWTRSGRVEPGTVTWLRLSHTWKEVLLMRFAIAVVLVLMLAPAAFALDEKAYQMSEDFRTEPLYDCTLNYYYYIPCPTYSWFWAFTGWTPGDIIGTCFSIGDQGTGTALPAILGYLSRLGYGQHLDRP
jgi:hypothetical protein